jgi:two-component system phosphate regulon response regulator PhoB
MSTILLVEDDPDIRHLVAHQLTEGGLDVIAAADGFAALGHVRQTAPDLVILDVRMPKMSGLELCRELRADEHTAEVPIIMLTARARPQDLQRAFEAGATDYVVKPFSPRDLRHRVEAALTEVDH